MVSVRGELDGVAAICATGAETGFGVQAASVINMTTKEKRSFLCIMNFEKLYAKCMR
jgi:hypothetical protein